MVVVHRTYCAQGGVARAWMLFGRFDMNVKRVDVSLVAGLVVQVISGEWGREEGERSKVLAGLFTT